ncbi:DUF3515 domain-containing protein [Agrococcus sp. Ld7]|uniref:DUF3515 domain-containing protein n=1 Tax=Agrococcus sp. Ld7 TaxID=649148 RepID=UPI00386D729F
MPRIRILAATALVLLAVAGCARTVSLPPADQASDPGCAEVIVTLPETIGREGGLEVLERRTTTAQGTAAWGDPSAVTLRCGMPVPAPSTLQCVSVGGVDWLQVGQEESVFTFVSYGREPATEVVIDTAMVTGATALDAISSSVDRTELVGACT